MGGKQCVSVFGNMLMNCSRSDGVLNYILQYCKLFTRLPVFLNFYEYLGDKWNNIKQSRTIIIAKHLHKMF